MSYRFRCRFCGSRFSLEQQLGEHERECEKMDASQTNQTVAGSDQLHRCKYCLEVFVNFGQAGAHRWSAHKDQVLADLKKSRERRKLDKTKIDRAIQTKPGNGAATPRPPGRPRAQRAETTSASVCPTCGGTLPATTAELVAELTRLGIPEVQAFEAVKAARRVLGQGAAG